MEPGERPRGEGTVGGLGEGKPEKWCRGLIHLGLSLEGRETSGEL